MSWKFALLAICPLAWADTPCTASAPADRTVTGTFVALRPGTTVAQTIYNLVQTGFSVSGGFVGTAATGHGNQVGTLTSGTFDGTNLSYDFVVVELAVEGTGHVDAVLSADGTSLDGQFTETITPGFNGAPTSTFGGAFNATRLGTGQPLAIAPATLSLTGAPGGNVVTDNSLMLYNCSLSTLTVTAVAPPAVPADGNWLSVSLPSSSLAGGASMKVNVSADPRN